MKNKVKIELEKMEEAGIIERATTSEWGSPIVVVTKPGREKIRICGDYSHINGLIINQTYLSPTIETAFSKMANMKYFGKIDLSDAYYQCFLQDKSKDVTTINTPFGKYRFNRLPYGIKVSPAAFQCEMEKLIGDCPGVIVFQDDILNGGQDQQSLRSSMRKVLSKLKQANVVK